MTPLLRPFTWHPTGRWKGLPAAEYEERLRDDALCRWNGLLLRYEQMGPRDWWWAVYRGKNTIITILDSFEIRGVATSHEEARVLAEAAARLEYARGR